ncbi:hypothetical protein P5E48_15885, partial [Clostridium perfringens]|nr:hypothetical protein [Clostridium perfringens]
GVFLGFANEFTKEVIAQNSKLSADDLKEILPNANKLEYFTFFKFNFYVNTLNILAFQLLYHHFLYTSKNSS